MFDFKITQHQISIKSVLLSEIPLFLINVYTIFESQQIDHKEN